MKNEELWKLVREWNIKSHIYSEMADELTKTLMESEEDETRI